MKKSNSVFPIIRLNEFIDEIIDLIPQINEEHIQYKLNKVFIMDDELNSLLHRKCATKAFDNLCNSMKKGMIAKSQYHAKKLKDKVRPNSNDMPASKGDIVSVIRYEHGYLDGRWQAKVKEVHGKIGEKISYTVTVFEEEGQAIEPFDIYIDKAGNIR